MIGWMYAVLGGVLIGVSSTLLLLFDGRIAGISGIVGGLRRGDWAWRAAFIAGLVVAGGVAMHLLGQATPSPASDAELVVAGLLVGFGTRLGGGCTSGHGVCGMGRLSLRSLVAVLVFVATAMVTVLLARHVSVTP